MYVCCPTSHSRYDASLTALSVCVQSVIRTCDSVLIFITSLDLHETALTLRGAANLRLDRWQVGKSLRRDRSWLTCLKT